MSVWIFLLDLFALLGLVAVVFAVALGVWYVLGELREPDHLGEVRDE